MPTLLLAQEVAQKQTKVRPDYMPSAVRIGVDAFSLGNTLMTAGKTKYEVQGDIDFHNYFFSLDLGIEENSQSGATYDYFNSGSYFRAGVDYNLMPYNQERSTIFLGLRYAATQFRQQIDYFPNDSIWQDDAHVSVSERGLNGRWIELVGGMKARVYRGLFLGYTVRYKIYKRLANNDLQDPYDLPGYGLARKNTNIDLSFFIYYRLAFRYKAVPPKPDKK